MLPRFSAHAAKLVLISLAFSGLALAAVLWQPKSVFAGAGPDPSSIEFYKQKVRPILQSNCYRCHAGLVHKGALRLDSHAGIMRGGKDGSVLTPGHPEQSRLITLIRHEGPTDDPKPMPPKAKLSEADIATVTTWIKAGALMPPDEK